MFHKDELARNGMKYVTEALIFHFCFVKASIEHRKLAVDLAEVILKWELQRIKDDQEQTTAPEVK